MSSGPSASLAALLFVSLLAPVGLSAAAVTAPQAQTTAADDPLVPANTTMLVELRANGDAEWIITSRYNLSTAAQLESFAELKSDFEAGRTSALGLPAFRRASGIAAAETGRQMSISGERRTGTLPPNGTTGIGTLSLRFTWTDFARRTEDSLLADDVFDTSEPWLDGLEPDQRLVLSPPAGYNIFDADGTLSNGSIQWSGPRSFDGGSPHATFTADETPPPSSSGTLEWALVGVVAVGAGGAIVYAFISGSGGLGLPPILPSRRRSGDGEAASETDVDGGTSEAASASAVDEATGEDDPDADVADPLDAELLSDEERIEHLLGRNGGRMKQADIVKETDWSNAKVSQLLSAMDEDDRIDKLRIGRENLISFPDEDVTDLED